MACIFYRKPDGTLSPAARALLLLLNILGLGLSGSLALLLRGFTLSALHNASVLANGLAAMAFVLVLCVVARGRAPGWLVGVAWGANLLALACVMGLAVSSAMAASPWVSVAGFAAMAGAVPAINAAWLSWARAGLMPRQ